MSIEMPNFDKSNPEDEEGALVLEDNLEKQEKAINISEINAEHLEGIKEYYDFEIKNNWSELASNDTLESMAKYRQEQMESGKLKVLKAEENNELAGTTVVVLKDGTMGKEIDEDEAHLAGIVVRSESEGKGIGEKMFQKADQVAKEAGKKSIRTVIDENNYSSIRLTTKSGYDLVGAHRKKEGQPVEYMYQKTFKDAQEKNKDYFIKAIEIGILKPAQDLKESSLKQVLIDPEDSQKIEEALGSGYRGVFLLKSEEHNQGDKSLMVFEKKIIKNN